MLWSLLILSLPQRHTTARMRAWRALKTAGAAPLRDGVYLLPAGVAAQATLQAVAADVREAGGEAHVFDTEAPDEDHAALFDRSEAWADCLAAMATLQARLPQLPEAEAQREVRKLRRQVTGLVAIDFFAGEAQRQGLAALAALEQDLAQLLAHGEPTMAPQQALVPLQRSEFQGRVWATRARPGVDRLASAWLIRRFIDPAARFVWLTEVAACPAEALGFDFDGARFSHQGAWVTFETLLASFGLAQPALLRLGRLVHALDVGGSAMPPEAAGVARVLAGMRAALADDDQLLQVAAGVFEGLWIDFEQDETT